MIFSGIDNEKKELLSKLLERMHKKPEGDFEVNFEKSDCFCVEKKGDKIFVKYENDSELFRSLLLLTELIYKGKDDKITETKQFETSGVMLDMSRAGVMKVKTVKEYIDYMALMGLNSLMLYMEDVYEVEGYEYFGYMRGRYSKEELKEIDAYGLSLGVEVIPCIQTLGHFEQYIKWTEGRKMSDTGNALMVGMPEAYVFLDKIIDTVQSCFTSRKIHIGMDEVWGMGSGNYLKKNGYKPGIEIFLDHIKNVKEITDKYNLEPMIWSDMFFRLASETHAYYDFKITDMSDMKPMIPEDIGIVFWNYYHKNEEQYDFLIDRHKDMTDNIIFAGGIWLWKGFVPDYKFTVDTTNAALSVCKKKGVKDVYATVWENDGCETDGMLSLIGCLLYGEHTYNKDADNASLQRRCNILFGADMDDFLSMTDAIYPCEKFEWRKSALCVKQIIYSDILCGLVDGEISDEGIVDTYLDLAKKYESLSKKDGYFRKHFEYIADVCTLAAHKVEISQKLLNNYKRNDEALREVKDKLLPRLKDDFIELKNIHYEMWNDTYKPFGFEIVDTRYGGKLARIDSAIRRLDDYLSGRIDSLPELGEKRLPFNGALAHAAIYNGINSGFMSRSY